MLAVIPYTTFPTIDLGIFELRTFGLMVALGVLLGAWLAARYGEAHGIPRDTTYSLGMRMVVAGVIGSRVTWVLTHLDDLDSPIDVIAIWEGGLQFSGGFIAAVIFGFPVFRHWTRLTRWNSLDGLALGLSFGLAIGRIGCYAVGEHFGRESSFFLATRYDGGSVREPAIGDVPLVEGMSFHNLSLYELLYMLVIGTVLAWILRGRRTTPGTAMAVFCLLYGISRFAADAVRVNDERVLGLTGAQYLSIVLVGVAAWVWVKVRADLQADLAAGEVSGLTPADDPSAATDDEGDRDDPAAAGADERSEPLVEDLDAD